MAIKTFRIEWTSTVQKNYLAIELFNPAGVPAGSSTVVTYTAYFQDSPEVKYSFTNNITFNGDAFTVPMIPYSGIGSVQMYPTVNNEPVNRGTENFIPLEINRAVTFDITVDDSIFTTWYIWGVDNTSFGGLADSKNGSFANTLVVENFGTDPSILSATSTVTAAFGEWKTYNLLAGGYSGSAPFDFPSLEIGNAGVWAEEYYTGDNLEVVDNGNGTVNARSTATAANATTLSPSFTFRIKNLDGVQSNEAVYALNIDPDATPSTPVAPTLAAGTFTTPFETAVPINIFAGSTSGSSSFNYNATVISNVASGTAEYDGVETVLFTPSAGFEGEAHFDVYVENAEGLGASATFTGTVEAAPEPVAPTLIDDAITADFGEVITYNPFINDDSGTSEFNYNSVTVSASSNASATVLANGAIRLTPNEFYQGTTVFTVSIANAEGLSDSATLTVTWAAPVNAAPVLKDQTFIAVPYGQPVSVNLIKDATSGSSDLDLTTLKLSSNTNVVSVVGSDGVALITPDNGWYGKTNFVVSIKNQDGSLGAANLTITWAAQDRETQTQISDSAIKMFEWVVYSNLTGDIISSVIVSEDNVKLDVNSSDEASITIPLASLPVAVKNDWASFFEYYDRGIALIRLNGSGARAKVVYAGPILKREFSTEEQTLYINAGSVLDYLAKIPAFWPAVPMTAESNKVWVADSFGGLMCNALLSGLNAPSGIRTMKDVIVIPAPSGTDKTYVYEKRTLWSVYDVLKDIRDNKSGTHSTEFRFVPGFLENTNRIGFEFITGSSSSPHINESETVVVPLYASSTNAWEPITWDISDDSGNVFTRLYVDGSGSDTIKIDAIDKTPSTGLTLIEVFDAGVDLNDTEMQAQLQARIINSRISEKDTKLKIAGDRDMEWIGHLGKLAEMQAGPMSAGTSTILRIVEIQFSTDDFDISMNVSLMELAGKYPVLPADKKKQATGGKGDKDSAGLKKADGPDSTAGGIDKGSSGFTPGGASDAPESPETKPKLVGGLDDNSLTLFESAPEMADFAFVAHTPYLKKDETHMAGYFASTLAGNPAAPGFAEPFLGAWAADHVEAIHPDMVIFEHEIQHTKKAELSGGVPLPSSIIASTQKKIGTIPGSWILSQLNAIGWFPATVLAGSVNSSGQASFADVGENNLTELQTFLKIIPGPKDNRLYFHATVKLGYCINGGLYRQVVSSELREIFFTCDRTDEGFENFERLASPAEQLFNSDGKHLVINFANQSSPIRDVTRTQADFFEIEAGKYLFPYTYLQNSYYGSMNSNSADSGAPLVDIMASKGITAEFAGGIFGMLYADFSTKQPIFAESEIEMPLPRVFMEPRRGAMVGTVANIDLAWDPEHVDYWRYNSWQSALGYSFVATSSYYGMTLVPHFMGLDDPQIKTLFGLQNPEEYISFNEKYCNKVWILFKGETEFKEIKLPTEFDNWTQPAMFSVAGDDESVYTYINGGSTRPLIGMNQAGKAIKLAVSMNSVEETPVRAFTGLSKNINVENFLPMLFESGGSYYLSAVSVIPSPWREKPTNAFTRDTVASTTAMWKELPKAGIDIAVENGVSLGMSYGGKYFRPLPQITNVYKVLEKVFSTTVGLIDTGLAYRWGRVPSSALQSWEAIPEENSPVPVEFGTGKKFKTLRAASVGNYWEFVGVTAVGEDGAIYYAGSSSAVKPEGYPDAGSDILLPFSASQLDGKKFIDAAHTFGGVVAIGEDRCLYRLGNVFGQATAKFTKVDDSSINGKIASFDTVTSAGVVIITRTDGMVYARGTTHAGGSLKDEFTVLDFPPNIKKWKDIKLVWTDSTDLFRHYLVGVDFDGRVWRTIGDLKDWSLEDFNYEKFKFEKISARKSYDVRDWTVLASDTVAVVAEQKSIHQPKGNYAPGPYAGTTVIFGGDIFGTDMVGDAGIADGEGSTTAPGAGGGATVGVSGGKLDDSVQAHYPGGEGSGQAWLPEVDFDYIGSSMQNIPMLADGYAGDEGATWRPNTARIGLSENEFVEDLQIPAGYLVVNPSNGDVVYLPEDGSLIDNQKLPNIWYRIGNSNGETVITKLKITTGINSGHKPEVYSKSATGAAGSTVYVDMIADDHSDPGASSGEMIPFIWDQTSAGVRTRSNLWDSIPYTKNLTTDEGVYVVNGSDISFTPANGFTGACKPISFGMKNSNGDWAYATLRIAIT